MSPLDKGDAIPTALVFCCPVHGVVQQRDNGCCPHRLCGVPLRVQEEVCREIDVTRVVLAATRIVREQERERAALIERGQA